MKIDILKNEKMQLATLILLLTLSIPGTLASTFSLGNKGSNFFVNLIRNKQKDKILYGLVEMGLINQPSVFLRVDLTDNRVAIPGKSFDKYDLCLQQYNCQRISSENGDNQVFYYQNLTTNSYKAQGFINVIPDHQDLLSINTISDQSPANISMLSFIEDTWGVDNQYGILGLKYGDFKSEFFNYLKDSFSTEEEFLVSYNVHIEQNDNLPQFGTLSINKPDSKISCTLKQPKLQSKGDIINDGVYTVKMNIPGYIENKNVPISIKEDYGYLLAVPDLEKFKKMVVTSICGQNTSKCINPQTGTYDVHKAPIIEMTFDCDHAIDIIQKYTFRVEGRDYLYNNNGKLEFRVVQSKKKTYNIGMIYFSRKELLIDVKTFKVQIGDPDYKINQTFWILMAVCLGLIITSIVVASAFIGVFLYKEDEETDYSSVYAKIVR